MRILKKMELIDREELIEILKNNECINEKIQDIVYSQPIVATATPKFEVEMQIC